MYKMLIKFRCERGVEICWSTDVSGIPSLVILGHFGGRFMHLNSYQ